MAVSVVVVVVVIKLQAWCHCVSEAGKYEDVVVVVVL